MSRLGPGIVKARAGHCQKCLVGGAKSEEEHVWTPGRAKNKNTPEHETFAKSGWARKVRTLDRASTKLRQGFDRARQGFDRAPTNPRQGFDRAPTGLRQGPDGASTGLQPGQTYVRQGPDRGSYRCSTGRKQGRPTPRSKMVRTIFAHYDVQAQIRPYNFCLL